MPRERRQEPSTFRWLEVPDRPPEEGHDPATLVGDLLEMSLEVTHDAVHLDLGVLLCDGRARGTQGRLADLERHEPSELTGCGESIEQGPRLVGRARTELDQGVGTADPGHGGRFALEDLTLPLGRVVLGEAGDLLEDLATHLVVEPLGGERPGSAGQAISDVEGEGAREVTWLQAQVDPDPVVGHRCSPHSQGSAQRAEPGQGPACSRARRILVLASPPIRRRGPRRRSRMGSWVGIGAPRSELIRSPSTFL